MRRLWLANVIPCYWGNRATFLRTWSCDECYTLPRSTLLHDSGSEGVALMVMNGSGARAVTIRTDATDFRRSRQELLVHEWQ